MAGLDPATAAGAAPMALSFNRTPDPVSFLPPKAVARLKVLRQHVADRHAVIPRSEDRLAASNAKIEAERRLSRLRAHPHQGGSGLKDEADPRVQEQQRLLDTATAENQRIAALYEQRSTTWRAASHVLSNVELWVGQGPGPLADYGGGDVKLAKGEASIADAIENRRRRVRELRASLHTIRSAPLPSGYAKQRLHQQIEELAARGSPSLGALIEHDGEVAWPTTMLKARVHNAQPGAVAITEVPDTVAMFAWLHREALLKKLDAEVMAEADDGAALSHAEREKRSAEVSGDLLAVERDEATLMFRGWADGLPVEPRADLDPVAVLNVVLVNAPVSRGTSPGMSWTR